MTNERISADILLSEAEDFLEHGPRLVAGVVKVDFCGGELFGTTTVNLHHKLVKRRGLDV